MLTISISMKVQVYLGPPLRCPRMSSVLENGAPHQIEVTQMIDKNKVQHRGFHPLDSIERSLGTIVSGSFLIRVKQPLLILRLPIPNQRLIVLHDQLESIRSAT